MDGMGLFLGEVEKVFWTLSFFFKKGLFVGVEDGGFLMQELLVVFFFWGGVGGRMYLSFIFFLWTVFDSNKYLAAVFFSNLLLRCYFAPWDILWMQRGAPLDPMDLKSSCWTQMVDSWSKICERNKGIMCFF